MRYRSLLLILLFSVVSSLVIYSCYPSKQKVTFSVTVKKPPEIPLDVNYVSVPDEAYDDLFSSHFGEDVWKEAKTIYRKQAGLRRFIKGDIFSVTMRNGVVIRYDLHHYKNRSVGKLISFLRQGRSWKKREETIALTVKTMLQNFTVEKSFKDEYPQFYEMARKRLSWDWQLLDKLAKGDAISFMVKGIFDEDILVHTYGILGFSVKSEELGTFTLTAYRDYLYGDYFTVDSNVYMSPPGYFRVPIDYGRITSPFGYRKDPFTRRKRFHKGIDIVARRNTPVHAVREGRVTFSGWKRRLGRTVVIDHGDGIKSLYGHLNRCYVSQGEEVKMGDVIGGAGNSGRSTSNHLHFTVYKNGKAVDPLKFSYERVWRPPYEVADDIRVDSANRRMALEESVSRKSSFFFESYMAEISTKEGVSTTL